MLIKYLLKGKIWIKPHQTKTFLSFAYMAAYIQTKPLWTDSGKFDLSLAQCSYRSWPQVIKGKPVHLVELVDGAVPTGAT